MTVCMCVCVCFGMEIRNQWPSSSWNASEPASDHTVGVVQINSNANDKKWRRILLVFGEDRKQTMAS